MYTETISPPIFNGVRIVNRPDLQNTMRVDRGIMPMVGLMERTGIRINPAHLTDYLAPRLSMEMEELADKQAAQSGKRINIASGDQLSELLFGHLKLKQLGSREKWTKSKARLAADGDVLKAMVSQHPCIRTILDWKQREKLRSTYTLSLAAKRDENDRIHTDFSHTTAQTGRLACVAPWTILHTTRGNFRIDEYLPQWGDCVITHLGNQRPILRKIYKGVDTMLRVCLTNGQVLTCTGYHQIWTGGAWTQVQDLKIGDSIQSYEYIKAMGQQPGECKEGIGSLSSERQADAGRTSIEVINPISQHSPCGKSFSTKGGNQSREASKVLAQQNGEEEPYVGQEWYPTSQLERGCKIEGGIHSPTKGRYSNLLASDSLLSCHWLEEAAQRLRDTSHRRKQSELGSGQSSIGNSWGSQGITLQTVQVSEITRVDAVPIWDIEVAGDHSYMAGGFFNHNSSDPNLQNIPTRGKLGKEIRNAFIPSPGMCLGSADASQIEVRMNAHDSQDPNMMRFFNDREDFYWGTASLMYNREFTPDMRKCKCVFDASGKQLHVDKCPAVIVAPGEVYDGMTFKSWYRDICAKVTALMVGYDASAAGLYDQFLAWGVPGWTEPMCEQAIRDYFKAYIGVLRRKKVHHQRAERYGKVWELGGRIRWIPQMKSCHKRIVAEGLRQAGNMAGQGGAAFIIKLWMAIIWGDMGYWHKRGVRILLQIHDELLAEGPKAALEDALNDWVEILRHMLDGFEEWFNVPLDGSIGIGEPGVPWGMVGH